MCYIVAKSNISVSFFFNLFIYFALTGGGNGRTSVIASSIGNQFWIKQNGKKSDLSFNSTVPNNYHTSSMEDF